MQVSSQAAAWEPNCVRREPEGRGNSAAAAVPAAPGAQVARALPVVPASLAAVEKLVATEKLVVAETQADHASLPEVVTQVPTHDAAPHLRQTHADPPRVARTARRLTEGPGCSSCASSSQLQVLRTSYCCLHHHRRPLRQERRSFEAGLNFCRDTVSRLPLFRLEH